MSYYLPEQPLEPRDPLPDCVCDECGNWFYGDERIYISNGRKLCIECFYETIIQELSDWSPEELADLVGAKKTTAEEVNDNGRMRFCLR